MSTSPIDERLINLLKEIGALSEDASMSGSLEGGAPQAIRRYNALLKQFTAVQAVPEGLFETLDEDKTSFAQLGVESRLLASYLEGESDGNGNGKHKDKFKARAGIDASVLIRLAPFVKGEDLSALVTEYMQQGVRLDTHILTSLAPFLDSSALGKLLRGHLEGLRPKQPIPPSEPEPPAAQPAPNPTPTPTPTSATGRDLVPADDQRPEKQTLEELAAKLRGDLTPEQRQQIAIRIAEIAHEQANYQ